MSVRASYVTYDVNTVAFTLVVLLITFLLCVLLERV